MDAGLVQGEGEDADVNASVGLGPCKAFGVGAGVSAGTGEQGIRAEVGWGVHINVCAHTCIVMPYIASIWYWMLQHSG